MVDAVGAFFAGLRAGVRADSTLGKNRNPRYSHAFTCLNVRIFQVVTGSRSDYDPALLHHPVWKDVDAFHHGRQTCRPVQVSCLQYLNPPCRRRRSHLKLQVSIFSRERASFSVPGRFHGWVS